jgi:hypothetical protein
MKPARRKTPLKIFAFQALTRVSPYLYHRNLGVPCISQVTRGRYRQIVRRYKGSDAKLGPTLHSLQIRIHALAHRRYEDAELYVSGQTGVSTGWRGTGVSELRPQSDLSADRPYLSRLILTPLV